ncbi:MAG: hypothetical protein Q8Q88_12855 [Phenylobacterium sp.]|uniref:CPBP family glutamic-type intramembrane protease n=1 Tax=Phenylobacterium sp. TaxID=1871053 RepID=UPI002732B826|nr:CPBP family glutamic-type intramembrane protease [Phenylobacterium sp.]MDP3747923.1 hypothetical protein [Phenylobacterium sp.]
MRLAARARFAAFVLAVLALPGGLMALGDPRMVDLGKLAMILSPGLAGLILNRGLGEGGAKPRWTWVAAAAGVSLAVAGLALIAALVSGVGAWPGAIPARTLAALMGAGAFTSVLEELGWAAGGLALAVKAFGRRAGVPVLGVVWAAWHLIPAMLKVGLFPDLEAAPPAMLAAFVAGCLVYRELLTRLRERARTWWAAAAGHAAPNILLAAVVAAGGFDLSRGWWFFPAPGGLVFLGLALGAVALLRRKRL